MSNLLTMNEFPLHTRLGNKLFNFAGLLGMVKKYNRRLVLPDYYLWKFLKNEVETDNNIKGNVIFYYKTDKFDPVYMDDFFSKNKEKSININLNSAGQHERAWEHCKEYILKMLEFKDEEVNRIRKKYKDILAKKTIGVSIRLGKDMVDSKDFYRIPHKWFIDSLNKYFPNWNTEYHVVCFSDNINEAKEIFRDYPFHYAEYNKSHILKYDKDNFHTEKSIDHLILGYLMDNFIISQSTFSWWQAYLCKSRKGNNEGKIIHSGRNFDGEFLKTMENIDYYPTDWIKNEIQ